RPPSNRGIEPLVVTSLPEPSFITAFRAASIIPTIFLLLLLLLLFLAQPEYFFRFPPRCRLQRSGDLRASSHFAMPNDRELQQQQQPPQNRFQHAGQASLAKLLDRKFEDRYETKRSVKQRQPFNINPRVHYKTTLWLNRIQTFREHTLCVDMSKPPVGQEFERFAEALAPKVRPRGGHAVPSYRWLQMGLTVAADGLLNLYDYRLSPHDTKRLDAMMHLMLKQGKLTKDPVREKQWAGLSILRTMVQAWLIKALAEGTMCWDQVFSRVGTMVWMSALQCRAGDFLKDALDDHPLPYLAYRDIELRLVGGLSLEHLTAKVTLRNVKGD
ncbi:MAG: hypothetical protein Q9210_007603, partial [Variospora velana]